MQEIPSQSNSAPKCQYDVYGIEKLFTVFGLQKIFHQ